MVRIGLLMILLMLPVSARAAVTYTAWAVLQSPAENDTIHTPGEQQTASVAISSSSAEIEINGAQAEQQFSLTWSLQLEIDSTVMTGSGRDWANFRTVYADDEGHWEHSANLSAQHITPIGSHVAKCFVDFYNTQNQQGNTSTDTNNFTVAQ